MKGKDIQAGKKYVATRSRDGRRTVPLGYFCYGLLQVTPLTGEPIATRGSGADPYAYTEERKDHVKCRIRSIRRSVDRGPDGERRFRLSVDDDERVTAIPTRWLVDCSVDDFLKRFDARQRAQEEAEARLRKEKEERVKRAEAARLVDAERVSAVEKRMPDAGLQVRGVVSEDEPRVTVNLRALEDLLGKVVREAKKRPAETPPMK